MFRVGRLYCGAVTGVVVAATFGVMSVPARADTVVNSCDEATFRSAVAAGGTVRFTASCQPLYLTAPVAVPSGLTVTVDATGFPLTLDGQGTTRLFAVTGGHLSLVQVTLTHGLATGTAGSGGTGGAAGSKGVSGISGGTADSGCGSFGQANTGGNGVTGGPAGAAGVVGPGPPGARPPAEQCSLPPGR